MMTIKQQGGIFGRNPTFNDVTVEGDLSLGNDISVTGDISAPEIKATSDGVIVGTTSGVIESDLKVYGADPAFIIQDNTASEGSAFARMLIGESGGGGTQLLDDAWQIAYDARYLTFSRIAADGVSGTPIEAFRVADGVGIVMADGNGIDFSATSGTGTSELFDDYEEGIFSPTVEGTSTAGTVSYTRREGVYTKVGNCVNFWIDVIWASGTGTGNLKITSLPFTSNSRAMIKTASIFSSNVALTAGNIATCSLSISATQLLISQMPTGGGAISDVSYDAAGQLVICGSYFV